MKLSCDVICDLLPAYAEGLTSEASNQLIENHIEDCPSCREILQNCKGINRNDLEEQEIIEPFKKFNKKLNSWRILSSLFFIMLALVIIPTIFRFTNDFYRIWMKNHPQKIEAIFAADCASGQKLIFPFAYDQGSVQDDGALYYDGTHFFSDEAMDDLADKINAWGL